jgi:hypothetical protein
MNYAWTLVALIALLPVAPQEDKVDDWKRYLPLHEGGEWEYVGRKDGGVVKAAIRVVGTKKVNDVDCQRVEWDSISPKMTRKKPAVLTHTLYVSAHKSGQRIQRRETGRDENTPETGDARNVHQVPEFLILYPLLSDTGWINFFSVPATFKPKGKEKVKVPGGEFECIRIAADHLAGKMRIRREWYLARDVGLVKDVLLVSPDEGVEFAAQEELLLTARRPAGKK